MKSLDIFENNWSELRVRRSSWWQPGQWVAGEGGWILQVRTYSEKLFCLVLAHRALRSSLLWISARPSPRSRVHVYGSWDNLFLKSLSLNHRLSVFYPWSLLEEIIHLGLDHKPRVMELSRMVIACVDEIPLKKKFAFKSFPLFPTQILVILRCVQTLSHVFLFETP